MRVLGVDIGGSHITAAPVDLKTGQILWKHLCRGEVNSKGSQTEIITQWSAVIQMAANDFSEVKNIQVGIAMPGPFDYSEGISWIKDNNKYEALYGLPVKQLLADALGISRDQIRLKNDAGCFLQGETIAGAARGFSSAIGMTLGTGIGTATMETGLADDAALWGMPFKDGITENYISTIWFEQQYQLRTGRVLSVKEMAVSHEDDKIAQTLFSEFAQNLALFCQLFVELKNPEVIVIGGNIMKSAHLFMPYVQYYLSQQKIHLPIHKAKLGEAAAIIGAAHLFAKD